MLLIFNERSLTAVLFKINNKSFNFCKHETENRNSNNYLLIRSLFTKITLNENLKKLYSCSLTRIEIIFIIYFIMSDNRLIINLSSRLIIIFNFVNDKRDDFKFKKSLSLKLELKSL